MLICTGGLVQVCSLGGGTDVLGGLYALLCHAFLCNLCIYVVDKILAQIQHGYKSNVFCVVDNNRNVELRASHKKSSYNDDWCLG